MSIMFSFMFSTFALADGCFFGFNFIIGQHKKSSVHVGCSIALFDLFEISDEHQIFFHVLYLCSCLRLFLRLRFHHRATQKKSVFMLVVRLLSEM
uniref:Secreted protein n=1 Tax=Lactuca sativa TaxID=4236 RepID=A0A9R1XU11_LACSA|nr:hypothetical protein LSAT_V11C200058120 [Lactuca sativa]